MTTLVNQTEEVNRLSFDLVIDVERKWFCSATRKPVRPNVITATPTNDFASLSGNAFVE